MEDERYRKGRQCGRTRVNLKELVTKTKRKAEEIEWFFLDDEYKQKYRAYFKPLSVKDWISHFFFKILYKLKLIISK